MFWSSFFVSPLCQTTHSSRRRQFANKSQGMPSIKTRQDSRHQYKIRHDMCGLVMAAYFHHKPLTSVCSCWHLLPQTLTHHSCKWFQILSTGRWLSKHSMNIWFTFESSLRKSQCCPLFSIAVLGNINFFIEPTASFTNVKFSKEFVNLLKHTEVGGSSPQKIVRFHTNVFGYNFAQFSATSIREAQTILTKTPKKRSRILHKYSKILSTILFHAFSPRSNPLSFQERRVTLAELSLLGYIGLSSYFSQSHPLPTQTSRINQSGAHLFLKWNALFAKSHLEWHPPAVAILNAMGELVNRSILPQLTTVAARSQI